MSAISPRPIADARVCLWQADSVGYYSGYLSKDPDSFATPPVGHPLPPSDGSRFLRGVQSVDERGVAVFQDDLPWLVSPTPMTPGQPELGLTGSITVAVAGS